MCRICQERPPLPSRFKKKGERICSRCFNNSPSNVAARRRYRTSDSGKAVSKVRNQRDNPRRIFVGNRYHSPADTSELAQRINAHIKGRLNAFKGQ